MTDQNIGEDMATDAASTTAENQAQAAKTYTQDEVDGMLARMRGSLEKKLLKPYQELGDPETLRQIKTDYEQRQQEHQLKKGEFEKILQEKAAKWEAEISKRDTVIKDYKVNMPLLSAAAKYRAVAPEQVKSLLAQNVRLNDDGEVEVVGQDGGVRYKDNGESYQVEDLVREFLDSNPHFVTASPATTNTKSNISNGGPGKLDITKLDMKNPEHRKVYAEYRKTAGIA
jgi:arsenate reductase-like glutaredoxin family protein